MNGRVDACKMSPVNAPIVVIRNEQSPDAEPIRALLRAAFPTDVEARLVDALRNALRLSISLVAERAGQIIGHIAFSPITIAEKVAGLGLAPVAVHPSAQRTGIGAELVRHGLAACRNVNAGLVVVLGDPAWYARFGFKPAATWNLSDDYAGGEAFQALELQPNAAPPSGGRVKYAPEFAIFSA